MDTLILFIIDSTDDLLVTFVSSGTPYFCAVFLNDSLFWI